MIIYAIKNGHYRTYSQPDVPPSVLRQIAIAGLLGKTEQQRDIFFREAAKL